MMGNCEVLTKFYVLTGEVRVVVSAKSSQEAAVKAINKILDKKDSANVGRLIYVGEKGFGDERADPEAELFLTEDILDDSLYGYKDFIK